MMTLTAIGKSLRLGVGHRTIAGRYAETMGWARDELALEGDLPDNMAIVALMYMNMGDIKAADTWLARALELLNAIDYRLVRFAGQKVGVKQVSDKIWFVSFMQYVLGYFDYGTRRLEPIENPFTAKVLPMSPAPCVRIVVASTGVRYDKSVFHSFQAKDGAAADWKEFSECRPTL